MVWNITNTEFQTYLNKNGIRYETSILGTPQQNGVSERLNKTLVEKARCLIDRAQAPTKLWAEAVHAAN